jgi:hypothetical protein
MNGTRKTQAINERLLTVGTVLGDIEGTQLRITVLVQYREGRRYSR